MSERSEYYRRQATYALEMAAKSPTELKVSWFFLAERWLEMAQQRARIEHAIGRFQTIPEVHATGEKTAPSNHTR